MYGQRGSHADCPKSKVAPVVLAHRSEFKFCAKLIAHAGLTRVFYQKGYAMLDGERVLKQAGVEIIRVIDSQQ